MQESLNSYMEKFLNSKIIPRVRGNIIFVKK